jgi:hypothetical protein
MDTEAAEPEPKTEEEIQDSIQAVARVNELVDSLAEAGSDRAQLEQIRDMILQGGRQRMFGGGGGSPFGGDEEPEVWVERPGEDFSERGGGLRGYTPDMRILAQAARPISGSRRGGFGGGGQPAMAGVGDYTVVLRAGDRELRRTLTVLVSPEMQE